MKFILALISLASLAQSSPTARERRQTSSSLLTDLTIVERYWGQITPYGDNNESYFGVQNTGLPDGCQVEQAHLLERHGSRFPTGSFDDGGNDARFGVKVTNWTTANSTALFTGPLTFLNGYEYLPGSSYLTGTGASQSFAAGVQFWNRYGRIIYNATAGQLFYNASFTNGTARPKPVLRTTGQSRIQNTQINWALGFFGPSYQPVQSANLTGLNSQFSVVVIPEGGTENNTLASYDSCFNDDKDVPGYIGDYDLEAYIAIYLKSATARFQQYAPKGFTFSLNDTYAMQSLCAYETNYIGVSEFCTLFTEDEWAGFEHTLDIEYFYDYSYGNPTGRAQGIGYLQELLARLQHQYITVSNSSVNSSLTNNAQDFPLNQPFYADFTHDDIIVSLLTAMSLDYINDPPNLTQYPPNPNRHFVLSHLTPFAARFITEVVGCSSANPTAQSSTRVYYSPGQYGYSKANATHKFIRMRLNNGILPLSTIRGGLCSGRTDGLCSMDNFISSQKNAYTLSNYNYVCFANYTIDYLTGKNFDGTLSASATK